MNKRWPIPAFFLLVCLITSSRSYAQEHPNVARGYALDKSFDFREIDRVNAFNGNLSLTVPLGLKYPVNGSFSYGLTLFYNSNAWDVKLSSSETTKLEPAEGFTAGLGWTVSLGRLKLPGGLVTLVGTIYESPDGSKHEFFSTLRDGLPDDPGDTSSNQSVLYTRDGSFLRMKAVSGSYHIEFPDGAVHEFDGSGRVKKMRGPFDTTAQANQEVRITYFTSLWELTDSQGRTQRVHFRSTGLPSPSYTQVVDRVELTKFNGGAPAIYQFSYSNTPVVRPCPNFPAGETITVPLLTSVALPDGSGFSMPVEDYIITNTDDCQRSGLLKQVKLPTLGKIAWTYRRYGFPIDSDGKPPHRTFSQGVATRKLISPDNVVEGAWTYQPTLTPPPPEPNARPREMINTVTIEVNDPSGQPVQYKTKNYFSVYPFPGQSQSDWTVLDYGLPFSRSQTDATGARFISTETFDSAGNLVRTSYVRYDRDANINLDAESATKADRRLASRRVVFNDDGNKFVDEDFLEYDNLGHYRRKSKSGNVGAGARVTFTSYSGVPPSKDQNWVLNVYSEQTVTESGVTAKREFCFDRSTGVLKRTRTLKSGAIQDEKDVVVKYTFDNDGNMTSEEYFGGDRQAAIPDGDICTLGLLTSEYQIDHTYSFGVLAKSKYRGASFFSLDQVIDQWTGFVEESRDTAAILTTYEYDSMGRVTFVRPSGDAWTQNDYFPASSASNLARVDTYRKNGPTGAILTRGQIFFDGFGRLSKQLTRMPGAVWSGRETHYNALGWKLSVSERGSPADKTEYFDYDPFGRPGHVRPPDGLGHAVFYSYKGIREISRTTSIGTAYDGSSVTEWPATVIERYDDHGRLTQVVEPSGQVRPDGSTPSVTTFYSYDIGNRLKHVSTTATVRPPRTDVALATNGATAAASSFFNGNYPPEAAINGDRKGAGWGNGAGGWNDASQGVYSTDWVRIDFNASKSLNEVNLFTLRDGFSTKTTPPTLTETFNTADNTGSGIIDFDVQYLSGSGWITVPGGAVRANNRVWRQFTFTSPIVTTAIRVSVHKGAVWTTIPNNYSRIVEIEAISNSINVALPSNGGSVTASSVINANYPASAVIDGDRTGRNWGQGGGWNDATENLYASDSLQVSFNGPKTIDEIDVFTLQDNIQNPAEPTSGMTFNAANNSGNGITDFEVQYLSGSRWLTVPNGSVTGNNNVWRQFTFSPITTTAIRVVVRNAVVWTTIPNNYSRIVEVEAYEPASLATVIQTRGFTYDNRGFLTSESHPEKGDASGNGVTNYFVYDSRGNAWEMDDVGQELSHTFDEAERLRRVNEGSGLRRLLKEFVYSDANNGADRSNGKLKQAIRHNYVDPPGGPQQEVDVACTETYFYTGQDGRVGQLDTTFNTGHAYTQSYTYNRLGQVTSITYPTCTHGSCTTAPNGNPGPTRVVTNSYSEGLLTGVTDSVTGGVSSISYSLNGMVNQVTHANGVVDTTEVNPANNMMRPQRIFTTNALTQSGGTGGNWDTGIYSYDGAGNITRMGADYFVYDQVSRLVEGTAFAAGNARQSYQYDPFGNIIQKTTTVNGTALVENISINSSKNRLATATYGPRGSLATYQGRGYNFDLANRLRYAPGKIFIYAADDERVWTYDYSGPVLQETFTLRDIDGKVLREYLNVGGNTTGAWAVEKDYLYRGDKLLSSWSPTEAARHFSLDHLGTPRLITNDARRRVALHTYYAFGQEASSSSQDAEQMKFTGHERDFGGAGEDDDLDYMHARYYNGLLGRFYSFDPIGGNPRSPQTWNRYAYATGNPLKYIDPFGLYRTNSSSPSYGSAPIEGYYYGEAVFASSNSSAIFTSAATNLYLSRLNHQALLNAAGSHSGPSGSIELSIWDRILSSIDDDSMQVIGDALVGYGDMLSFGLTELVRDEQGLSNTINESSGAYVVGEVAGVAHQVALGGLTAARVGLGAQTRIGIHSAHHSFGSLGKLRHIQINWWIIGQKGSGGAFRIPLFFK